MQVTGLASREDAAAYAGGEVGVPRGALPAAAADEIYVADLVGLAVVNVQGDPLGQVMEVQEFGAHPVLRLIGPLPATAWLPLAFFAFPTSHSASVFLVALATGFPVAGVTRLVPFVEAYVREVDVPGRRVVVDWQRDY